MLNLQHLRNRAIDGVINVLNSVKYVPSKHDIALNSILDNSELTDAEKLKAMRKYFAKAATEITNA